jgi:hypothetical protein
MEMAFLGSSAFVVLSHKEKALRTGMFRESWYVVLLLCRKKATYTETPC